MRFVLEFDMDDGGLFVTKPVACFVRMDDGQELDVPDICGKDITETFLYPEEREAMLKVKVPDANPIA